MDSKALNDLGLEELEVDSSPASTDYMIVVDPYTSKPKRALISGLNLANFAVQGVAAGYKVATGSLNLTATKFAIATGLTSISNVVTSFKKATAPSAVVSTSWNATAGALSLYGWKYTNSTTNTLVAASSAASVHWTAIGQ